MLLNWFDFYSWINGPEGPERPIDEIYNNDEELDAYVDLWITKKRAEQKESNNSGKGSSTKSWSCD